MIKVTPENYFHPEVMKQYLSVSQYKDFAGTMGQKGCEAKAMATQDRDWETDKYCFITSG